MSESAWTDDQLLEVHERRLTGESWGTIAAIYGDDPGLAKGRYSNAKRVGRLARVLGLEAAQLSAGPGAVMAGDDRPTVRGIMADERPDPAEVWQRAEVVWRNEAERRERRRSQSITFTRAPACLVFLSDLHLGGAGVNYPRIRREVEIARDIPNSGTFLVGDLIDNFIIGKLAEARHAAQLSIRDEWIMAEHVMELLGPKLVANVAGNHDEWTRRLGGFDVLRAVTSRVRKDVIYDTDEALVTWQAGAASKVIRARHKWMGSSIYNAIHGQGRAARWDGDADIYIGAHTHRGALYGTLNVGERRVMGVQLGSYKEIDPYQRREGFSTPSPDAALALVLTEAGRLIPFDCLDEARDYMRAMY